MRILFYSLVFILLNFSSLTAQNIGTTFFKKTDTFLKGSVQIPCQQSHRQGIKDLIELKEKVAIFKNMVPNTKDGNTFYNCEVGALPLDSLADFN